MLLIIASGRPRRSMPGGSSFRSTMSARLLMLIAMLAIYSLFQQQNGAPPRSISWPSRASGDPGAARHGDPGGGHVVADPSGCSGVRVSRRDKVPMVAAPHGCPTRTSSAHSARSCSGRAAEMAPTAPSLRAALFPPRWHWTPTVLLLVGIGSSTGRSSRW